MAYLAVLGNEKSHRCLFCRQGKYARCNCGDKCELTLISQKFRFHPLIYTMLELDVAKDVECCRVREW